MKKLFFIISILFFSSVYAQLPNLNFTTKEDAFLLDYFFNKQNSQSRNTNYSFFSDKNYFFVGNEETTDFFIYKPSIKKDEFWFSFLLVSNSSTQRRFENVNYMSSLSGYMLSCSNDYFLRRLSRSLYSEQYIEGLLVHENEKPAVARKNVIDKDRILTNIKNYICK
jgi:hypothetical protein